MISIIIPFYNSEKTLHRTIESILHNSFHDYEVILINDGSTDQTVNTIDEYFHQEQFILKTITHQGVAHARNVGLSMAKGDYIAFIDSDDTISKDYLEKLYVFCEENQLDWAMCNYKCIINGKEVIVPGVFHNTKIIDSNDVLYRSILSGNQLYNLSSNAMGLYKRDVIYDHQLSLDEDLSYGEDIVFNLKLCPHIKRFGYLNEPLYEYHQSDKRLSSTQLFELLKRIEEIRINNHETITKEEKEFFINQMMLYLIDDVFPVDNEKRKTKIDELIKEFESYPMISLFVNETGYTDLSIKMRLFLWILKGKKFDFAYFLWRGKKVLKMSK